MDIAQMRMMLVLAECKSMTTTAKKLHVTQPALTYQLKVIENELGFKVFNRTRTGTSLTAEGTYLHESIKRIVIEYDEAVRLTRAMAKGSAAGTIRVGINGYSRDTVSFFLNVAQFSLSFSLIPCGTTDPVKLLQERVVDFWSASDSALVTLPSSLRFLEITTADQSVYVPNDHEFAGRTAISIEDLKDETVWMWPRGAASSSANVIRDQLESYGTDIMNFIPGVPAVVTAFTADGVVVYDDGYLPPPDYAATQLALADAPADRLGLVYLASQERRLAPVMSILEERLEQERNRRVTSSELAAQRIVSVTNEIGATVRRGGMKDVKPLVEYGLRLGVSANHLMSRGLLAGMNQAEEAYQRGEAFMAEMLAAVGTANIAMEILQPYFRGENERPATGTAAIGTVVGDKHDIGKHLVRIMLESHNITVTDLGRQVAPEAWVEHLRNHADCNLLLISLSNTNALDSLRETMTALCKAKLRDQVFVMLGGSASSPELAREIGADAYTASAEEAADRAAELLRL